jgi:hypothetical protein
MMQPGPEQALPERGRLCGSPITDVDSGDGTDLSDASPAAMVDVVRYQDGVPRREP